MISATAAPILLPVAALVTWSLIMLIWTGATRVPTMRQLRVHPQKYPRTQDLGANLPPAVQWKADNYNHLMEQPTIFYASALALAMIGEGNGLNLFLAWAYVASRVVHSLVHATTNPVMVRFSIFVASSGLMLALAISLLWTLVA